AFVSHVSEPDLSVASKQVSVLSIIAAYRSLGVRFADLDPLKRHERPVIPELDPAFYGLTEADLDRVYAAANTYFTKAASMTSRDLLKALRETYCRSIGADFMHISDPTAKRWIQERLESTFGTPSYSPERKRHILQQLTEAEGLERYLHTKYVGQKRFSLEGGDSLIPLLDTVIHRAGEGGVKDIVIGMAHRGRLNVLVNTLGKNPRRLFDEFEGKFEYDPRAHAGDVKYHMGFSADVVTGGGPVHLAL